ncbi:MAG TPA: hypothetical protein VF778_04075 [Xanthobacteraceae bacterium]
MIFMDVSGVRRSAWTGKRNWASLNAASFEALRERQNGGKSIHQPDPNCPECHKSEIMDIFLIELMKMHTRAGQGTVFPLNGGSERVVDGHLAGIFDAVLDARLHGPVLLAVVLAPS